MWLLSRMSLSTRTRWMARCRPIKGSGEGGREGGREGRREGGSVMLS